MRDAPEYKRIFCIQDHHQQFIRSLKKKIIGIGEIFVAQESITGGGSDRRILLLDVSPGCMLLSCPAVEISIYSTCKLISAARGRRHESLRRPRRLRAGCAAGRYVPDARRGVVRRLRRTSSEMGTTQFFGDCEDSAAQNAATWSQRSPQRGSCHRPCDDCTLCDPLLQHTTTAVRCTAA